VRKRLILILSLVSAFLLIARAVQFKFPLKSDSVRFAIIGDMGTCEAPQYEVAQRMIKCPPDLPVRLRDHAR